MLRATDELRKEVWDLLVKHKGNREKVADVMGKSLRTLNRYIADLNLYADMEKAGLMRNAGPPRGEQAGTSQRAAVVVRHIKKNKGEVDYGALAVEMYGADNDKTRNRVYVALNDLKANGTVALDGQRWFVI